MNIALALAAHVKEACALGRAQPLEAVWPQAVGQVRRRWPMQVSL